MARPIWTGSLSFGLVNVPVGIYSAIEQQDIRFHQFQQGTKRRIHNQRVAEGTKKEVPYEKVVKGYEISKNKWVMVEPEDLEAVERYEDTYRERVLDMIKRKGKGEEIAPPEREREGAEVVDLMEALRESLDRGGRKSPSRRKTASRAKNTSRSTSTRRKKAS